MAENMADKMGTADFLANLENVLSDYAGMKYLLDHYCTEPNWRTLLGHYRYTPVEQSQAPQRTRELRDYMQSHPVDSDLIQLLLTVTRETNPL
jgi:hypothetical protein